MQIKSTSINKRLLSYPQRLFYNPCYTYCVQSISDLITLPTPESKPLTEQQKRWMVQNEIMGLVEDEQGLKLHNWKRYVQFLKKYKYSQSAMGQEKCRTLWKKTAYVKSDKDVRPLKKMTVSTFGFFTSHLDVEGLEFVLSVCKDRVHRTECVTTYILSLSKGVENSS